MDDPAKTYSRLIVLALLALSIAFACYFGFQGLVGDRISNKDTHVQNQENARFRALVFSKTVSYRHDSIQDGITAIKQLGIQNNFEAVSTENADNFNDDELAKYQVVVWLSTTGNVLNTEQQAAFERYIKNGGGYAGVHAASDTEYEWDWYGKLVGAYFRNHPDQQPANVLVEDTAHPSAASLPQVWNRFDEWYDYRINPRGSVNVLLRLDETSYSGGGMGSDHPIAWCHNFDGGRSWYTGLGHTSESFSEPEFLSHLLNGISTAAGVKSSDCSV